MSKGFYDPMWGDDYDDDDHFIEIKASKLREDQYTAWVLGFLIGIATAVAGSAFVIWITLQ